MSVRVQVILNEEELAKFKKEAKRESKSLSAWMRDAASKALMSKEERNDLKKPAALKKFFQECGDAGSGNEPDWNEQKRSILEGYRQRISS